MTMPGFTAEAALGKPKEQFRINGNMTAPKNNTAIVLQQFCADAAVCWESEARQQSICQYVTICF
jgi:hypothetical protein